MSRRRGQMLVEYRRPLQHTCASRRRCNRKFLLTASTLHHTRAIASDIPKSFTFCPATCMINRIQCTAFSTRTSIEMNEIADLPVCGFLAQPFNPKTDACRILYCSQTCPRLHLSQSCLRPNLNSLMNPIRPWIATALCPTPCYRLFWLASSPSPLGG